MRLKSILAALVAMLFAIPLAAQAPVAPPEPAPDGQNLWYLDLSNGGQIAIQLRPDVAPQHVERIKTLTREGFYNGAIFHRVIEGFMAQTGDPKGTGEGGSTLPDLKAEFNDLPHLRGTVSMARTDNPDSANSQFFIMFTPRFTLDHKYTVLGRVISGMAYVDAIERGEPPANPTRIVRAAIAADAAAPPAAAQAPAAPAAPAAEPAPAAAREAQTPPAPSAPVPPAAPTEPAAPVTQTQAPPAAPTSEPAASAAPTEPAAPVAQTQSPPVAPASDPAPPTAPAEPAPPVTQTQAPPVAPASEPAAPTAPTAPTAPAEPAPPAPEAQPAPAVPEPAQAPQAQ